jgi:hypothetical protein
LLASIAPKNINVAEPSKEYKRNDIFAPVLSHVLESTIREYGSTVTERVNALNDRRQPISNQKQPRPDHHYAVTGITTMIAVKLVSTPMLR